MSLVTSIQPMLDAKRIPAFIVALAIYVGFSTVAVAQDCSLRQAGSLPMTVSPDGTLAVPITIAGRPEKLQLDINQTYSLISGGFADELKLATDASNQVAKFTTFNVGHSPGAVTLPDISIGQVHGTSVPVLRIDGRSFPEPDVVGVLGTDLLSNFDVELDFKNGKLNLFSSDHCPGKVVYWADSYASTPIELDKSGHLTVPMTLDGVNVRTALALWPGHSFMGMETAQRLFGLNPDMLGMTQIAAPHRLPELTQQQKIAREALNIPNRDLVGGMFRYSFKALAVGGLSISNPVVDIYGYERISDCEAHPKMVLWAIITQTCFGGADISLQLDELQKLHLYIAFKEKMLYVTAADAHK